MSGTFMDGGSFDGGNAGGDFGNHGGIDSFSDGGVESDSNNLHQHGHEGGFSLGALLGLNQQQHHSFLAHLLGLDHDAHDHGGEHGGDLGSSHISHEGTSGIGVWTAALQSITLATFFTGFRMTPAVWMLCLFMGYIGWLCVIYWVRHHEPFANAVLGTRAATSSTSSYDRRMIAGIKEVLPIKTSSKTGDFYVPVLGENVATAGSASATVLPSAPLVPVPAHFGSAPQVQDSVPTQSAVNVPVYDMSGPRLRTIVDR